MLLERYSSNGTVNTVGEVKDLEERLPASIGVHLRKLYEEYGLGRRKAEVLFKAPTVLDDYHAFSLDSSAVFSQRLVGNGLSYRIRACGTGDLIFVSCGAAENVTFESSPGEVIEHSGRIYPEDDLGCFILMAKPSLEVHSFEIYTDSLYGGASRVFGKDKSAVSLPKDFSRLLGIYDERGTKMPISAFDLCEDGMLVTDSKNDGVYTLDYLSLPENITSENIASAAITLPPVLFDALCYMCAADICPVSDGETVSKLTYKYREILENFYDRYTEPSVGRNRFYGVVRKRRRVR